jgi:hypothetical protein
MSDRFRGPATERPFCRSVLGLAEKNKNRLVVEAQENLGGFIADSMRLKQTLLNLLSNACKFTTHDDRPWSGEKACGCGGAGMPCPSCNVSNADNPPRLPRGFQRDESLDDE